MPGDIHKHPELGNHEFYACGHNLFGAASLLAAAAKFVFSYWIRPAPAAVFADNL
ncbi:MAG: hypothetical protein LBP81_05560 [Treponema sp.]|nr:hypothetical protein [Treponema sp.]